MGNILSAEQMKKLKTCKTGGEAKAPAEKENIEFSDEQLEAVAGGFNPCIDAGMLCKFCGLSFPTSAKRNEHELRCPQKPR